MPFVKFKERGRSYTARASITRTGMLSFSDGARKRFHFDDSTHCVLYYDEETSRIGVGFTSDTEADGAIKIRFRNTGADVGAKRFVEFFNIGVQETTVFPVEFDENEQMVVIDLNKGKARGRREGRPEE